MSLEDPADTIDACSFLPPAEAEETLRARLEAAVDADPLVMRAADIAATAHASHVRDEGDPYIVHPLRVALTLLGARAASTNGITADVVAAALCHDVLEDAPAYARDVRNLGPETYRLVSAVTDDWFEDVDYYDGIVYAGRDACRVKVADRLDNLRFLHLTDSYKQSRYLRSTQRNYVAVASNADAPRLATGLWTLVEWHTERMRTELA